MAQQRYVKEALGEVGDIVETGADLIDNLYTSQGEEMAILESMHSVDMKSDSWLSKNVRPLFLVFACGGWLILSALVSLGYKVDPGLVLILERWGEIAIFAYFGVRGWEKVERTRMKKGVVNARIQVKEARISRKELKLMDKLERNAKRREE